MDLMEQLRDKARANVQKVAFFEADDPKMMEVVGELTKEGLADEEANAALAQRFAAAPDCPFKAKAVRRRAKRPMDRCLMMQRIDDVDITFGGLCCSTGDVIVGGQTIIGLADGIETISSLGIFNIPG